MLKRVFSVQNSFLALLSTLFFLILNGVVQAAPTTTTPPAPGVPAGTPASSILFNAVPDPMKWLNEFEARVNNTGITSGAVHLAGAFILAVVTYKIIRALMEKNNAKMFVALVYCVISTVALNLSKPNNGWQQTMRHAWGSMIGYSQASVGGDITTKMAEAMDNFGTALSLIPVFGFMKIGTELKVAKEGVDAMNATGKAGQLAVKTSEAVIKGVSVTADKALGSLAVGATLINSYVYLIYYSGMVLVICSIAIPLTCIFIATGNWKPISAIFMTMIGSVVLGAIAPIIFVEVIEIAYIRPIDAAVTILKQMATEAAAAMAPAASTGFQLPNLNPLEMVTGAFEKVTSALAIAASAMAMLLFLVIGGVVVGLQIITKLPDVVYGTLKS